jgi:hypothetical protein
VANTYERARRDFAASPSDLGLHIGYEIRSRQIMAMAYSTRLFIQLSFLTTTDE